MNLLWLKKIIASFMEAISSNEKLEKIVEKKIEAQDFEGALKTACKISSDKQGYALQNIIQAALQNKDFNFAIKVANLRYRDSKVIVREKELYDIMVASLENRDPKFAREQASSVHWDYYEHCIWLAISKVTKELIDIEKTLGIANSMSRWDVKEQATILAKLARIAADSGYFDLAWQIAYREIVLDHDGENIGKKTGAMEFVIEKVSLAGDLNLARKYASTMHKIVEQAQKELGGCRKNSDEYWDARMDLNYWASSAINAWLAISRASKKPDDLKIARGLITESLNDDKRQKKLDELEEIEKSL